eukprot:COSAG01_NODE_72432_length_253_cov_0.629870_1_plen_65_part_01
MYAHLLHLIAERVWLAEIHGHARVVPCDGIHQIPIPTVGSGSTRLVSSLGGAATTLSVRVPCRTP